MFQREQLVRNGGPEDGEEDREFSAANRGSGVDGKDFAADDDESVANGSVQESSADEVEDEDEDEDEDEE